MIMSMMSVLSSGVRGGGGDATATLQLHTQRAMSGQVTVEVY